LAEKGVQITKRILKKTTEAKQDFWLGLLAFRTTPLESGPSPAELLMGRRLRTAILDVQGNPSREVIRRLQTDHSRGPMVPLNPGDSVRIKKGAWATKAQVLGHSGHPRSYTVVTENGRVLRRNRQHLLLTREPFRRDDQDDNDDYVEARPAAATMPAQPAAPTSVSSTPALRRSLRQRRPPERLAYDQNFVQVP
ncbi:uncharacterized protein LOC144166712, partial [Haemaphysalis longicornis]